MSLENNIILNVYSAVILTVVILYSRQHHDTRQLQNSLFLWIARLTFVMLIADSLSRFDGLTTIFHPVFNSVGNFLLYFLGPLLPILWFLYIHLQAGGGKEETLRLVKPFAILLGMNGIFCVLSLFTGWIYHIDEMNLYHRGPLFVVPVVMDFALMFSATAYLLSHRKNVDYKHFINLIAFPLLPIVGMVMQLLVYNVPSIMNCLVLALLIVFLNIQNQNIYTDHLTGIYNRKRLDKYMEARIGNQGSPKPFAGILIDVDEFKAINDTFGHGDGDRVLREIAQMLRSCLRDNDFVARYGGDEFFVVVETGSSRVLEQIIRRIQRRLQKMNDSEVLNQKISLSMGYDLYKPQSGMTAEDFQNHIDGRMYHVKKKGKENPAPLMKSNLFDQRLNK